jgi:RNA polymerase sigma-70 factor (ECF subfamily)
MTDADESDEVLLGRYAAGDAVAFERLYRRHEMRTWRYIERTVGNRATADELMQEVWFSVAREAARYRPTARFTTWMFTIAHNRVVDWLRSQRPHSSLESMGYEAGSVIVQLTADPNEGPLATVVTRDQSRALGEALAQLSAEQRDAFLMQIEGDLSVEEIAAVTAVSFETAKSRLRYARMNLRNLLKEQA